MTESAKLSWNKRKVKPVHSVITMFAIAPLVGAIFSIYNRNWQPFIVGLVWDALLCLPLLAWAVLFVSYFKVRQRSKVEDGGRRDLF